MITRRELKKRLPLKLQIGDDVIFPLRELQYSESNISKMMQRIASTIVFWGVLKARAVRIYKNAAQDVLEKIEDLKVEYKAAHPRGRLADAALYAVSNSEVRRLYRRRDKFRERREKMEACYEAALTTSRLLQSVGAMRRSEIEHLHDSAKGDRDNG